MPFEKLEAWALTNDAPTAESFKQELAALGADCKEDRIHLGARYYIIAFMWFYESSPLLAQQRQGRTQHPLTLDRMCQTPSGVREHN
eukprot:6909172-Pyramimonas_sp.AAC.1